MGPAIPIPIPIPIPIHDSDWSRPVPTKLTYTCIERSQLWIGALLSQAMNQLPTYTSGFCIFAR
ncbi:hypothetical protein [Pontibacter sp. HJ8]